MHKFWAERAREWANAGTAITANSPITATTIMISVKVKPAWGTCPGFIIIEVVSCLSFRADSHSPRVLKSSTHWTRKQCTTEANVETRGIREMRCPEDPYHATRAKRYALRREPDIDNGTKPDEGDEGGGRPTTNAHCARRKTRNAVQPKRVVTLMLFLVGVRWQGVGIADRVAGGRVMVTVGQESLRPRLHTSAALLPQIPRAPPRSTISVFASRPDLSWPGRASLTPLAPPG